MKKRIAIVLALLLGMISLCGCMSAGEREMEIIGKNTRYSLSKQRTPLPVSSLKIRNIPDDVMPISGYVGPAEQAPIKGIPIESTVRQEVFDLIAEAGVNLIVDIHSNHSTNPAESERILEFAQNSGVNCLIRATDIMNLPGEKMSAPAEIMADYFYNLSHYKSFAGLFGIDEPNMLFFPAIKEANNTVKKVSEIMDENFMLYLNIGPSTGGGEFLTGSYTEFITYSEYADRFIASDLPYVMYDNYPFEGFEGEINASWFTNMSIIGGKAEQAGIPWMAFVQAGGRHGGGLKHRIPNEGEFHWNVNTLLAYGAKGICYFTLCYPPEWIHLHDNFNDVGLITPYGTKTSFWHYAKKADAQIAAIDHVLMNAKNEGVIVSGTSPAPVNGPEKRADGQYRELTGVEGRAFIGCFDYQGKTALYVVNNSTTDDDAEITLTFDKKYGFDIVQRAQSCAIAAKTLTLRFAAGEAALVVLR